MDKGYSMTQAEIEDNRPKDYRTPAETYETARRHWEDDDVIDAEDADLIAYHDGQARDHYLGEVHV